MYLRWEPSAVRDLCQSFLYHRVTDAASLEAGYKLLDGVAFEPFQVLSETLSHISPYQGLIPGEAEQGAMRFRSSTTSSGMRSVIDIMRRSRARRFVSFSIFIPLPFTAGRFAGR